MRHVRRTPRGPIHAVRLAVLPPAFGLLAGIQAPPLAVLAYLALSLDLLRGFERDLRLQREIRRYAAWRTANVSLEARAIRLQRLVERIEANRRARHGG